ncbi:MAG: YfcE family phosphodiesterase [Anaerolineales bacterium]|nr:YfcE family phosphodiesterase [Anaerolineales bacterium]
MGKIVLGLIADTHIPDRAGGLRPDILPIFRAAGVTTILHAGDVSVPAVLTELETVAPVHAVRGNRDIYRLRALPMTRLLDFEGVTVGLAHGQGNLWFYLHEKLRVYTVGYSLAFYLGYLHKTFPTAQAIVFGHSHQPIIHQSRGKLIINPGSACCPDMKHPPSVALLHLENGKATGELVWLKKQVSPHRP